MDYLQTPIIYGQGILMLAESMYVLPDFVVEGGTLEEAFKVAEERFPTLRKDYMERYAVGSVLWDNGHLADLYDINMSPRLLDVWDWGFDVNFSLIVGPSKEDVFTFIHLVRVAQQVELTKGDEERRRQ